ncbi:MULTISPECIES: hypothetical protein [Paraburkholderia]|uniref:Uncharacterized protein n=1 Tax=Paraburkholderia strydomiana TaxID=1245417 RepID=A0ABW9C542_9BURK
MTAGAPKLALEDYRADQQKARFELTALIVLPIDRAIHHFERIAASDLTNAIDRLRANGIGRLMARRSDGTGTSFTVHYMRLDAADGERCHVTKGRYLGQPLHTTKRFSGKREFQDLPCFKTDGRCQITGTSKRKTS